MRVYGRAIANTAILAWKYNARKDPNAFHHLLNDLYRALPPNKTKVLKVPVISPKLYPPQIVQEVVAIGNAPILLAIEQIPCSQSNQTWYTQHPDKPKIKRGRAFSSILEAIGMGVLTANEEIHNAFLNQMHSLSFASLNNPNAIHHEFQTNTLEVITNETNALIKQIEERSASNEPIEIDFLVFSLKILLKSFYPNTEWNDEAWIGRLARAIEEVSHQAFKHIMDPYSNMEKLRQIAAAHLDEYIDKILEDNKPAYLTPEYVRDTSTEIKKQIIIALLFAGGDNIRRLIEHCLVEFGQQGTFKKYFADGVAYSDLLTYMKEVERLYTIIFAQPGEAEESFTIEYEGERFKVKAGDHLHYTTWIATTDEKEWGPHAREFNPEANKDKHAELQADLTFGAKQRRCRGKIFTHKVAPELLMAIMNQFEIRSYVGGNEGVHPIKYDFNTEVDGAVKIRYTRRLQQTIEKEVVEDEARQPVNGSRVTTNYKGLAEKSFICQLNKSSSTEESDAMEVEAERAESFISLN